MQAIRFLGDYLNNDRYYQVKYAEQNLVRATNQCVLLKKYIAKEKILQEIFENHLKQTIQ